jgi:phytanoyl-CoA hydroxylase
LNKYYFMKKITTEQVAAFKEDGFLILPQFFSNLEVAKLFAIATDDEVISKNSYDLNDNTGKKTKLALWFTPGNEHLRNAYKE